jgi:hypothetical protein
MDDRYAVSVETPVTVGETVGRGQKKRPEKSGNE